MSASAPYSTAGYHHESPFNKPVLGASPRLVFDYIKLLSTPNLQARFELGLTFGFKCLPNIRDSDENDAKVIIFQEDDPQI